MAAIQDRDRQQVENPQLDTEKSQDTQYARNIRLCSLTGNLHHGNRPTDITGRDMAGKQLLDKDQCQLYQIHTAPGTGLDRLSKGEALEYGILIRCNTDQVTVTIVNLFRNNLERKPFLIAFDNDRHRLFPDLLNRILEFVPRDDLTLSD